MIDKNILRNAFISSVKVNNLTEKQIADACQLSASRINKAISGASGSNAKWPTEYICLATYFLIKKMKGSITPDMNIFYNIFTNNIDNAAKGDYKSLKAKNYLYKGRHLNISQLSKETGVSRYIVTQKIEIAEIETGENVTNLFNEKENG